MHLNKAECQNFLFHACRLIFKVGINFSPPSKAIRRMCKIEKCESNYSIWKKNSPTLTPFLFQNTPTFPCKFSVIYDHRERPNTGVLGSNKKAQFVRFPSDSILTLNNSLKYSLHADKTTLWALRLRLPAHNVTSVRSSPSNNCGNVANNELW